MSGEADTSSPTSVPCVVLGAGSWGTALAIQIARSGASVLLWGRNREHLEELARERRNRRYLPEAQFPESLRIEADLATTLQACRDVIVAVPSHALRGMLREVAPYVNAGTRLAWATKGFELTTGLLPHEVARDVLGEHIPTAVISGPTFAREVGAGLPTAMTVAATDTTFATQARAATVRTELPRVHVDRHRRRRGRRCSQECPCDWDRAVGRARLRRQYPDRAHRPRIGRDDAPRCRTRRAPRNVHGSRRAWRSGSHLHRQSITQSALRLGFGGWRE